MLQHVATCRYKPPHYKLRRDIKLMHQLDIAEGERTPAGSLVGQSVGRLIGKPSEARISFGKGLPQLEMGLDLQNTDPTTTQILCTTATLKHVRPQVTMGRAWVGAPTSNELLH
jgi:hypothetical protein